MLRRSTLIVLIVFLVLMGVVVYLQYADEHPGTTAESTPNADFLAGSDATSNTNATVQAFEELFDFSADAVTGLQVVAADGRTLVMEKNADGAFVLTEPETSAELTDAPRIYQTIDALSRLEAAFDMDPTVALSVLGLDNPAYTVAFTLEGGEQVDLLIGSLTPPKTGYYVQLPGGVPKAVGKVAIDDLVAIFDDPPVVPAPTPEPEEAE